MNTTFTGIEIGYYFICKKKLWFAHGVEVERGHVRVKLRKRVRVRS